MKESTGPTTTTGRVVRGALKGIRPTTVMGKIAVALGAEIGGAMGDMAQRAFAGDGRRKAMSEAGVGSEDRRAGAERSGGGTWSDDLLRRARRAEYAADALREQREAGRRAEEAYRRAYEAKLRNKQAGEAGGRSSERPRTAGRAGSDTGGPKGPRIYRYKGRAVADYYAVLGVGPKAGAPVIDKAYRTLMKVNHPDQGGDARKAQMINEAYTVLRNPESRQSYDRENGL
ncbi:MAG: DnaJ domain-containing protein [Actinobacteria bacterium]|nr:DnaJ domain-containing protein [Actinomycetota bacterium]